MIRTVSTADHAAVCEIYNHYVVHTNINFDIEPLTIDDISRKVGQSLCFLVYELHGKVIGFAAAASWKTKKAYELTAETSLYMHPDYCRNGYGNVLLAELISILKLRKMHSLLAAIIMPNTGSVKVHQRAGFVNVGHLKEAGFKNGKWHDVTHWQLLYY